jgi:hypothetical protein
VIHGWGYLALFACTIIWPLAGQVAAWWLCRRAGAGLPLSGPHMRLVWMGGATGCGFLDAAVSDWPAFAAAVVMAVLGWWLNRPRPPRQRRRAGAGAARIAAMVATMRERALPRAGLRPVPGAAR